MSVGQTERKEDLDKMEKRKLAIIVAWLVPDPEPYEGKTNADVEREIIEERPLIPYVGRIEKVTVLDVPS